MRTPFVGGFFQSPSLESVGLEQFYKLDPISVRNPTAYVEVPGTPTISQLVESRF
jgi:hypothetical protein